MREIIHVQFNLRRLEGELYETRSFILWFRTRSATFRSSCACNLNEPWLKVDIKFDRYLYCMWFGFSVWFFRVAQSIIPPLASSFHRTRGSFFFLFHCQSWTEPSLNFECLKLFYIFFCMSARERVKNTKKFARGISYFFVGRSQWKNSVVFTCSHPVWPRYPRHEPQRELHTEFLSRLYFSSSSSSCS